VFGGERRVGIVGRVVNAVARISLRARRHVPIRT
jgi:hypothetical protein